MQVRHSGPGHSGVAARNLSLAAAAIFFCGVFLSGCDERIVTFRDTTIPCCEACDVGVAADAGSPAAGCGPRHSAGDLARRDRARRTGRGPSSSSRTGCRQ